MRVVAARPQHTFKVDSILTDEGERPLLEQFATQLASAERTLAAQHASVVELLEKHLAFPKPATAERSPRPWFRTEFTAKIEPINGSLSRPHSQNGVSQNNSAFQQLMVADQGNLNRSDFFVQRPPSHAKVMDNNFGETPPALLLPGQTEQELGRSILGRCASPSLAWPCGHNSGESDKLEVDKLVILPTWATRISKRKVTRGSQIEVMQPVMDEPEEEDLHTIRAAGLSRHVVLHPMTASRALWDVCSLVLVFYDVIMTPLSLFDLDETATFLAAMQWVARVFWTLDIAVSFISGYVGNDGIIDLRPASIASRYLRTWFLMDLFVVSMDWIDLFFLQSAEASVARMGKASRGYRIVRMVRLLRLARMGNVLTVLLERLPSDTLVVSSSMLKLFAATLGIGHLGGCVWFAVGRASPMGINWIDKFEYSDKDLGHQYIISLRWALSQLTGGMDEIMPISVEEQVYSAIVFVISFWAGTILFSILTSHLTQVLVAGSHQTQQLNMLRRYLAHHRIPRGLAMRAQRNAQHVMNARQRLPSAQAEELMDLLSHSLRVEVHFQMYFPALQAHPFFRSYMEVCPHVVRKICHEAVSTSANSHGDIIFHLGEAAGSMFLLKSGCLRYTWGPDQAPKSRYVKDGEYVAEAALWVGWVHRGALTVVEDSVIFQVNAEALQAIVNSFERTIFDPAEYARWFADQLNESEEEVTDLPSASSLGLPPALIRASILMSTRRAHLPAASSSATSSNELGLKKITQGSVGHSHSTSSVHRIKLKQEQPGS